jgi:hypothetical protein
MTPGAMGAGTLFRLLAVAAAWAVTGAGIVAIAFPQTAEASPAAVAAAPSPSAAPAAPTGPAEPAGPAPASAVPEAGDLLGRAVRSSHAVGYRGTQTVAVWNSGRSGAQGGSDVAVLTVVTGGPGLLRMEVAGTAGSPGWVLVQRGDERTMYGLGSSLLGRAPADFLAGEDLEEHVQRLLDKYVPVLEGPTEMIGRPAWRVSILRKADKRLVERWTIDAATGVILERDGFERHGQLERMVSFSHLQVPYAAVPSDFSAPQAPASRVAGSSGAPDPGRPAAATQERSVSTMQADATGFRPPKALPAGYQVASQTRLDVGDETVVHLTYSDGLEPLSLFRQPGVLQRGSLPQGANATKLKNVQAYSWESFPRGLAWQDGQASFVLVGAASTDELISIANALPQSGLRRSIPQRIGHLLRWLRHVVGSIF